MSDAFTDVAKMKKIKEDIKAHEGQIVEMTLENGRKRQKSKQGRLIEVPLRRGKANSAFIDQISFSIHEDTFSLLAGYPLVADDEYIVRASMVLADIFGFGITEKAKHSGGRFYDSCWLMGTDNAQYGRVHFGGQNNTMLIEVTATGCNAASDGWESRLYNFILQAVRPKITRIDIAKDFFQGEYTPEQAKADRLAGKFTNHNMMPDGESVGTDWESNNGKGKTYYVGSRESSKYVRVYEKGKQLGDKESQWVRFEIEFKAKDIVIPFEVLTVPGEYFGGAYPVCAQFQEKAKRIEAVKKNLELTFERCIEVAKNQVGRAINAAKSKTNKRLLRRDSGTSPLTMRCAKPSTMAVLPTPGSPISTGLFLVRRCNT